VFTSFYRSTSKVSSKRTALARDRFNLHTRTSGKHRDKLSNISEAFVQETNVYSPMEEGGLGTGTQVASLAWAGVH
jgi:hypothetical protein